MAARHLARTFSDAGTIKDLLGFANVLEAEALVFASTRPPIEGGARSQAGIFLF
jgi:hypothetical protein